MSLEEADHIPGERPFTRAERLGLVGLPLAPRLEHVKGRVRREAFFFTMLPIAHWTDYYTGLAARLRLLNGLSLS